MSAQHEQDMDLMARYLAGSATADEVRRLEQRLTADPALRREFLSHANVDAALHASVRPASQNPVIVKTSPARWRSSVKWIAAAAALMLLGLVWHQNSGVEVRVLAASEVDWKVGDVKKLRDLDLSTGSLQIALSSGVVLDLIAPARMHFEDAMHARVLAGAVTADVGPAGTGFTLDTPHARVVDLGTRFGVSVQADGNTDVAVFQGKVEVHEPGSSSTKPAPLTLNAGDSVRVTGLAQIRRQALIATRGESAFIIEPAPPDALVTSITDNIEESGFHSFYTLQRGAMKPGVRLYSTLGRPRWQPLPGESFPDELTGADVIGTFSADRHERDLQLHVTVSRPCSVYLMLDSRSEVPAWVRSEFADTGHRLRSGPWAGNPVVQGMTADANGEVYVEYTLWKKNVSAADAITLGPPYPEGQATYRAMYGIAVK